MSFCATFLNVFEHKGRTLVSSMCSCSSQQAVKMPALGRLHQCFRTAAINWSGTCPTGSLPSTPLIIACLTKHVLISAWRQFRGETECSLPVDLYGSATGIFLATPLPTTLTSSLSAPHSPTIHRSPFSPGSFLEISRSFFESCHLYHS